MHAIESNCSFLKIFCRIRIIVSTLCVDLNLLMIYTYYMPHKRTVPKQNAARDLLADIATGTIAALLLIFFALLIPTA